MALSSHGLRSVQSQAVCQKEAPRHRLKLNVLCNGKSRLVLVARRISDVKAEPLTDTPRTQFAHAFDLTLSGCGHQAPVLRPAPLRAERIEHLPRAAKPIHAILLPNGEGRQKDGNEPILSPTVVHMKDAPSPAAENGRFGARAGIGQRAIALRGVRITRRDGRQT